MKIIKIQKVSIKNLTTKLIYFQYVSLIKRAKVNITLKPAGRKQNVVVFNVKKKLNVQSFILFLVKKEIVDIPNINIPKKNALKIPISFQLILFLI